jgi:nucleotide-binding universal stress UspA family protein
VIDFATSLAERYHLAIDGCAIIDVDRLAPPEPVPMGASAFKVELDAQAIATARQRAAETMTRLQSAAQQRGVPCATAVPEGDIPALLNSAVQRCDVLLCGHTAGGDAGERSLLHAILKQSPRPAIVVPQRPVPGEGVLVAYDGSAQAARALAAFASSGLAAGRTLRVVSWDDGTGTAARQAETARVFLERHGIACDTATGRLTKPAGEEILDEAARVSAGLIVMGAMGRSAVREFFFGSATRSMLEALPVPVFLDH